MVAKSSKHVAEAAAVPRLVDRQDGADAVLARSAASRRSGPTSARPSPGTPTDVRRRRCRLAALPRRHADRAKIDSDAYVPLIGQITRGADVAKAAKAADKQINAITGCTS